MVSIIFRCCVIPGAVVRLEFERLHELGGDLTSQVVLVSVLEEDAVVQAADVMDDLVRQVVVLDAEIENLRE